MVRGALIRTESLYKNYYDIISLIFYVTDAHKEVNHVLVSNKCILVLYNSLNIKSGLIFSGFIIFRTKDAYVVPLLVLPWNKYKFLKKILRKFQPNL